MASRRPREKTYRAPSMADESARASFLNPGRAASIPSIVSRTFSRSLILALLHLLLVIPLAASSGNINSGVDPCTTLANKLEASVAALAKKGIIVDGSVGFATPSDARNCLRNFRFRADRDVPALDTIINALDNHYVYKHLAVQSPEPALPSDVNIITYLKAIREKAESGDGINSLLRFHNLIFRAIDSLNDGHTALTSTCFYGVGLYTLPLPLVSVIEGGKQIIRVGGVELLRGRPDLIARGLFGFNFSRYVGAQVVTIEGEPALGFIAQWADKYVGTYRSAGARVNAALAHRTVKGLGTIDGSQGAFTVRAVPPRKDALDMLITVDPDSPPERVLVPWIADFPRGAFSDSRSYWFSFCRKTAGDAEEVGASTTEGGSTNEGESTTEGVAAKSAGGEEEDNLGDFINIADDDRDGAAAGAAGADDDGAGASRAAAGITDSASTGGAGNEIGQAEEDLRVRQVGAIRGYSVVAKAGSGKAVPLADATVMGMAAGSGFGNKVVPRAAGGGSGRKSVLIAEGTVVGMVAPRRDQDPPPLVVREAGVVEEGGGVVGEGGDGSDGAGYKQGLNSVVGGSSITGDAAGAAPGGGTSGAGAAAPATQQQPVQLSAEGDLYPVLLLPDGTAAVWLHTFSTKGLDISATRLTPSQYLYSEAMRALSLARSNGKRIVIDVRGNSGGIIQTAYGVVRALVGPDKTPLGQLQMPQQLMVGNSYTLRLIKNSATFFYNSTNYCDLSETTQLTRPVDFTPFEDLLYSKDGEAGNYSARVKLVEMLTLYDQSDDFSGLPMVVVSDGTCFSACAVLTHILKRKFNIPMVTVGGFRDWPLAVSSSCLGGTLGSLEDGITQPLVGSPLAADPRATRPFRMQMDLGFAMLQAYGGEGEEGDGTVGVGATAGVGAAAGVGGSASGVGAAAAGSGVVDAAPCEFDFLEADAHIDLTLAMVDKPRLVWAAAAEILKKGR